MSAAPKPHRLNLLPTRASSPPNRILRVNAWSEASLAATAASTIPLIRSSLTFAPIAVNRSLMSFRNSSVVILPSSLVSQ